MIIPERITVRPRTKKVVKHYISKGYSAVKNEYIEIWNTDCHNRSTKIKVVCEKCGIESSRLINHLSHHDLCRTCREKQKYIKTVKDKKLVQKQIKEEDIKLFLYDDKVQYRSKVIEVAFSGESRRIGLHGFFNYCSKHMLRNAYILSHQRASLFYNILEKANPERDKWFIILINEDCFYDEID